MKARKAKPKRPTKKQRETFAAANRRNARRKAERGALRDRRAGPVNVIEGPIPKRKPGKIAAGGALAVAFEFSAQELRDLRVLAVARGYPVPITWSLQRDRAAAKWMLPKFVRDQIEASRPKVVEVAEGGAP